MAYPGWDGPLVGTRAKAFRALLKSKRMTPCRATIATAGSAAPSGPEGRRAVYRVGNQGVLPLPVLSRAAIRLGEYIHGKVKASEPKKEPEQELSTKVQATLLAFSLL